MLQCVQHRWADSGLHHADGWCVGGATDRPRLQERISSRKVFVTEGGVVTNLPVISTFPFFCSPNPHHTPHLALIPHLPTSLRDFVATSLRRYAPSSNTLLAQTAQTYLPYLATPYPFFFLPFFFPFFLPYFFFPIFSQTFFLFKFFRIFKTKLKS